MHYGFTICEIILSKCFCRFADLVMQRPSLYMYYGIIRRRSIWRKSTPRSATQSMGQTKYDLTWLLVRTCQQSRCSYHCRQRTLYPSLPGHGNKGVANFIKSNYFCGMILECGKTFDQSNSIFMLSLPCSTRSGKRKSSNVWQNEIDRNILHQPRTHTFGDRVNGKKLSGIWNHNRRGTY